MKKRYIFLFLLSITATCSWLVWTSITPSLPKPETAPYLYFNPSRDDLKLIILRAIQQAKNSIFLCMYGLTDPTILRAIKEKIEQGLHVTIYYDPKGSIDLQSSLKGALVHPVYQSGIMHQKVLIIDGEMVFTGSTNFTKQSLKMHDNLLIGFVHPQTAQFLQTKLPKSSGYLRTLIGGQDLEIWLLPDPKGRLIAELKKKIRSAGKSLRIALFTLTHPVLVDEIIHASKRGVDVTVILDLHSALGASKDALDRLRKAKVKVKCSQGFQLMHHKLLCIDERTLITGSANWTKSAFLKNSDHIFILNHLNETQKASLQKLWYTIETSAKEFKSQSK